MKGKINDQQFKKWIEILNKIPESILMNANLDDLTTSILEAIQTHLKSFGGIIMLLDREKKNLKLHSFSKLTVIKNALKLVPTDIYNIKYPLHFTEMLIGKVVNENKIMYSDHLRDFFYPAFKPAELLDTIQTILRVKSCIGVPIRIQGIVRGVLFIAAQEKNLSENQFLTMQFYANLSGLALENGFKIEEINERYETEKETTAILSHELKTPIAIAHHSAQTILMMLEKYRNKIDDQSITELLETAHDIQHGMDRLTKICTSIFNLREVENKVPQDVHLIDLKKQFNQIIYTYERKAKEKKLDFYYHFRENRKKYFGGIIQMEQIITILLDNAIKYTEKGCIFLEIEFNRNKMICRVTDSGCGVPKNKRDLVFGKFYRNIKKGTLAIKKEGLGLGLYIAKKIIDELKGNIKVEDNPKGKGTCFTAEMPVYTSRTGK